MTRSEKIAAKKDECINALNSLFLKKMTLEELQWVYAFVSFGYLRKKIQAYKAWKADGKLIRQRKLERDKRRSPHIEF